MGAASGFAPGPLLALVLAATLRGGFSAGARVAAAPLITDVPIVVLSLTVLSNLPPGALAAIAVLGGGVLVSFGVESLVSARTVSLPSGGASLTPAQAMRRGVITNLTSPHPWMFWMTAGGTALMAARETSMWSVLGLLVGFYSMLVGAKMAVAVGVAAGRHHVSEVAYRRTLAATGALLCVLGVLLAVEGVGWRCWGEPAP